MNHAQSFLAESINLMKRMGALSFLQSLSKYVFPTSTPLLKLTEHLNNWNKQRISRNNLAGQSQDLSIDDVATLKKNIQAAINRSSVKPSEVLSDQILFLVIGAIQIQAQTHSDKAWKLVNQSIQSNIQTKKERRIFQFGMCTTAMIICLSTMMLSNSKTPAIKNAPSSFPLETAQAGTDPVTISLLQLAYTKMQSGTCQLPQAAMLPDEQRQAYLLFVNKGVIEVQNVESLRQALGYVNCLYPQELMRPQLPSKI